MLNEILQNEMFPEETELQNKERATEMVNSWVIMRDYFSLAVFKMYTTVWYKNVNGVVGLSIFEDVIHLPTMTQRGIVTPKAIALKKILQSDISQRLVNLNGLVKYIHLVEKKAGKQTHIYTPT